MSTLPVPTGRQLIKALHSFGFEVIRVKGSHHFLRHPDGRCTTFLCTAQERGCRTLDGLGMLVRQGAASFRLWTGVEPDLKVMFAALK
jgi:predicted RNA binding protein YcfA (HicA-like mRNA interferase family)